MIRQQKVFAPDENLGDKRWVVVRGAGTRDEPLRTSVWEAGNLWNEADACVTIPLRVKAMPCYEIIFDEHRL